MVKKHRQPVPGQIVRRGGQLRVDQGHIPVPGAEEGLGLQPLQVGLQGAQQGLVFVFPPAQPVAQPAQIRGQARPAAGVQIRQGLAHGQQHRALQILGAPLGQGVKAAHGVQLVAEELHPHRLVRPGAEHVQNPAPQGKLARALHHVAAAVAQGEQSGGQLPGVRQGPHRQLLRSPQQGRGGHGAQAQGLPGGDEQPALSGGQVVQGPDPLLLPLA